MPALTVSRSHLQRERPTSLPLPTPPRKKSVRLPPHPCAQVGAGKADAKAAAKPTPPAKGGKPAAKPAGKPAAAAEPEPKPSSGPVSYASPSPVSECYPHPSVYKMYPLVAGVSLRSPPPPFKLPAGLKLKWKSTQFVGFSQTGGRRFAFLWTFSIFFGAFFRYFFFSIVRIFFATFCNFFENFEFFKN